MSWSFSFCFRFNSSFLFVASVPSYQLFFLARLALPFLSFRAFRCVHPFVSTLILSTLTSRFTENLKKCSSREKHFFQVFKGGAIWAGICRPSSHLRPLAATCGHLPQRPLAATCGHLRPLEWLQVTLLWKFQILPVATCPSGHLQPLAATCPSGHLRPLAATCGHLRPLEWLQVTLLWKFQILPVATCPSGHLRPLAATCGHLRPLAATCGHLRPLAATCGHSSGCKWLQVAAFLNFK